MTAPDEPLVPPTAPESSRGRVASPGVRIQSGWDTATDPWHERHRVRKLVAQFVVAWLVLWATLTVTPGITIEQWWAVVLAAFINVGLGALVRPLLVRVLAPLGWVGALALAIFGNFAIMYLALQVAPGIETASWWPVFVSSWIYAVILAVAQWISVADDDDIFLVQTIRQSTRQGTWGCMLSTDDRVARDSGGHPTLGVIFVQLDGMPAPVLDWAVKSGNLPTLARWIRSGQYEWKPWWAQIPATTPVSQAGLLHGSTEDMPGFRWYEKDTGRLLVANHPPDAAEIESRVSNGRGLLADNGVSISNLFSGDADRRLLVMSALAQGRKGIGASANYSTFFSHPTGFTRAVVMTVGEMIKEKFQARAQARRQIEPRISRKGTYVVLRAITNVLLRDLNTSLVIDSMMRGAKSIYVDFVDYDEIAHHAGVQRMEALRALEGLDAVLAQLERAVRYAPRPYRFVCVSDHGQSQGATFRQRYGMSLEEVIKGLMSDATAPVASATSAVEDWGPVNTYLSQLKGQSSLAGGISRRATRHRTNEGAVALGPAASDAEQAGPDGADRPEVVVAASGNLAGVWFPRRPERLSLETLEQIHPELVAGLATHPGVACVVGVNEWGEAIAVGGAGARNLDSGAVEGEDPLLVLPEQAGRDLARVAHFSNAPDLVINSMYDPVTDEVAAFEELVGCHGGAGGWQNRAILVYPTAWGVDPDLLDDGGELVGAHVVHRQMVRWLERVGHRQDIASEASGGSSDPVPDASDADTRD